MNDISQWLLRQGGIWGLIALALGTAVLYLENKSKKTEQLRVTDLEEQIKDLKLQLKDEHSARLADMKTFSDALMKQADEYIEAMKAVGRWGPKR